MATMTNRNLDDDVKASLRVRAAQHGRSMEEEVRSILPAAVSAEPKPAAAGAALVADIRALVAPFGGIELDLPARELQREPPDFSGAEFDR